MDTEIQAKEVIKQRKKIDGFIMDEIQNTVISKLIWKWVAIELVHRQILKTDMFFV